MSEVEQQVSTNLDILNTPYHIKIIYYFSYLYFNKPGRYSCL